MQAHLLMERLNIQTNTALYTCTHWLVCSWDAPHYHQSTTQQIWCLISNIQYQHLCFIVPRKFLEQSYINNQLILQHFYGKRLLDYYKTIRMDLGPSLSFFVGPASRVKQSQHEAHHSSASNAKVYSVWRSTAMVFGNFSYTDYDLLRVCSTECGSYVFFPVMCKIQHVFILQLCYHYLCIVCTFNNKTAKSCLQVTLIMDEVSSLPHKLGFLQNRCYSHYEKWMQ